MSQNPIGVGNNIAGRRAVTETRLKGVCNDTNPPISSIERFSPAKAFV